MALSVAETLNSIEPLGLCPSAKVEPTEDPSKEKYRLLKRRLKEMSEKNEDLVSELSRANKRLRLLSKEKNILLDRICKLSDPYPARLGRRSNEDYTYHCQDESASTASEGEPEQAETPVPSEAAGMLQLHSLEISFNKPTSISPPLEHITPFQHSDGTLMKGGTTVPSSRPKRMRRGPVEPKMRRVQPLEKNEVTGEYKLPARVGILTVHSLGRVVPLPSYHNDRYIWPPGFKVSRTYLSMVNPDSNTVYTCSVEENGDQGPKFRVVAEDCEEPIIANSATGVWTAIVKKANEIRSRDHSNSASGPDYYGFTHATIAKMIQDLPGADQCLNYVWQKFGVMHQRTAAGVAAAAQKKLTNLEIMGSANKKPPPTYVGNIVKHDMSPIPTFVSKEETEEVQIKVSPHDMKISETEFS